MHHGSHAGHCCCGGQPQPHTCGCGCSCHTPVPHTCSCGHPGGQRSAHGGGCCCTTPGQHHGGSCTCGAHGTHDWRRFTSRRERVEALQHYLSQLKAEVEAVEEKIASMGSSSCA